MFLKILNVLFKILSWIVVSLIGLALIGIIILPNFFNIKPYVVLSGSMEPVIHTGSVVWINENDKDVAVNDIIAFRLDDSIAVTHRVIDIQDDYIYTKGDANESPDLSPITMNQVMGKYFISVPLLGYITVDLNGNIFKVIFYVSIIFIILFANSFLESLIEEKEGKTS